MITNRIHERLDYTSKSSTCVSLVPSARLTHRGLLDTASDLSMASVKRPTVNDRSLTTVLVGIHLHRTEERYSFISYPHIPPGAHPRVLLKQSASLGSADSLRLSPYLGRARPSEVATTERGRTQSD
jgi:hypothetical protein